MKRENNIYGVYLITHRLWAYKAHCVNWIEKSYTFAIFAIVAEILIKDWK